MSIKPRQANGMRHFSAWDGRPMNTEASGWHWVEDADGLRPLLWRGNDWSEPLERGEWQDRYALLSTRDVRRGLYYGPVSMPPSLEAIFRAKIKSDSL